MVGRQWINVADRLTHRKNSVIWSQVSSILEVNANYQHTGHLAMEKSILDGGPTCPQLAYLWWHDRFSLPQCKPNYNVIYRAYVYFIRLRCLYPDRSSVSPPSAGVWVRLKLWQVSADLVVISTAFFSHIILCSVVGLSIVQRGKVTDHFTMAAGQDCEHWVKVEVVAMLSYRPIAYTAKR